MQKIYEKLAVDRGEDRKPIFVYWDRKCLRFGLNWEKGFLNGLLNSQVIVLLISAKVIQSFSLFLLLLLTICFKSLERIIQNASKGQDNVLIEYLADIFHPSFHFFFFDV